MLKIQHIEMLLAIEQAGSIRAASKSLGKTQPAVTKALRQAEAELGASIFKRAPSGAVVTEEGKPILRRARVIQAELRRMQEEVDQRRGLGTGKLNVIVSPLAANRLIAPTIRRFRRKFPKVLVQLSSGHNPISFGPLRDGQVDLVIGPEPQGSDASGLTVQFLVETPIAVITGLGSRWRDTPSLAELSKGDWLMIGTQARKPYLQHHFTSRGLEPPEPMITSDSIFSILTMLQEGDFLCTYPALLLEQTMSSWRIRGLSLEEPLVPTRIAAMTSSERPPTPALQYFNDCVQQVALNEFGQGYAHLE